MGAYMQQHDIFIGSMLDELNLRFAPSQSEYGGVGGLDEMVALQQEFEIFKKGRPLKNSIAALNLLSRNNDVKRRWLELIGNLGRHPSNLQGMDGEQAIITALVDNLRASKPLPVFFASHSMLGERDNKQVKITPRARAVHYIEQDYIVISLPMQSVQAFEAYQQQRAAAKAQAALEAASAP
ncbi:hypothetical protein [Ottowia testudinis]|uniref:Uncharacterized protein n=1 Tax=Ottowia testudinis TaxID=2816950 RepID=A0A975CG55_9BURK|nr:hypothetical protein [Ottowia testudinis]QTD45171.1 hypothetical protein J1M35_19465 [Ottowia testudinis]